MAKNLFKGLRHTPKAAPLPEPEPPKPATLAERRAAYKLAIDGIEAVGKVLVAEDEMDQAMAGGLSGALRNLKARDIAERRIASMVADAMSEEHQ